MRRNVNAIKVELAAAREALKSLWAERTGQDAEDFDYIQQAEIRCLDVAGIDVGYGAEIDKVEELEQALEEITGRIDTAKWNTQRGLMHTIVEKGRVRETDNIERVKRFLDLADRKLAPARSVRQAVGRKAAIAGEGLLHPAIVSSSWRQYQDGHLREAVLNALLAIGDLLRSRTGLTIDGKALVEQALSPSNPYLILSDLDSESGRNDQAGFMQIISGAFVGIRNPRAHSLEHDLDEIKAMAYLVFASLLARRISEAIATDRAGQLDVR